MRAPVLRLVLRAPWLVPALFAVAALTLPAHAATYWTVPEVMKSFFARSSRVSHRRVVLPDPLAQELRKRGVRLERREWIVYVGETEGRRDGYAMVDEEKGMHEPIDFAVLFTDRGVVARVEILTYREAYGDEVRADRFRAQFRGKSAGDPIRAGEDIDIISGASISSHSIANGVKRDALVLQAMLREGLLGK